jgi:uncharacterized protein (TIGR03437 family)
MDFGVVLHVTAAETPVKPVPSPAGFVIVSASSGNVTTREVSVYASSVSPLNYQVSATAENGDGWLSVSPSLGTASASSPGRSTISVNPNGLKPGVYRGGVSYASSSAAVRTVNITLVVPAGGATAAAAGLRSANAQNACTPTKLVATEIGLTQNYQQAMGWPTELVEQVLTDCGTPVAGGQVTAYFSNGDPPLTLTAIDEVSGIFSGTWTPRGVSPQVSVTSVATAQTYASGSTNVTGEVMTNTVPLLAANGTVSAFGGQVGRPLAPGSVVQIYGSNLATAIVPADSVPLATEFGGVSVLIGGVAAPLYYVSPGQVNAQIPFELSAGSSYQVQVNSKGALSTPGYIQLAEVSPGIASMPSGQVIAQRADFSLITADSPVHPGEAVIVYLVGLGANDTAVPSGTASPSEPLAHPLVTPTLTLDGKQVQISFAGLTPGSVGLYQINFRVPAEALDGDLNLV